MIMRRYIMLTATVPLFASLALLAGCGLLSQPKIPPMNRYRIAPTVVNPPAVATACPLVLQVRSVGASTPWATNDMLYTETTHSVASYAYHQWAADPATMLTGDLVEALGGSGLYRGVIGALSLGNADLILSVTLTKGPLQVFSARSAQAGKGDSATDRTSRETLALDANLTDSETGNLIASKSFSAEQSAAPNPQGGVVAANALAGKLIGQILDWLAQTNPTIKGCTAR
ncbi:MAG: ABC-type transport auxiliary lipoprotein family protein [Gammaproteobacteria bacterium]